jgi:protein ImuB
MPQSSKKLALFAREVATVPRAVARLERQRKPQLWLAVCLPNLALDALAVAVSSEPAAVVEPQRGQLSVVAVNDRARAAGIEPGRSLSAALALAATLKVLPRSPQAERASLESLASAAQALTPAVSIEPPESLLLEVSGSLELFGGLEAIKARLGAEIDERRWFFRSCAAPTAMASLWLARGLGDDVLSFDGLTGRLGSLPLRVTQWPAPIQALLRDMGLGTIGDCLRLPRDGFARRVGRAYLSDLDRALGRQFDSRAEFAAPERWSASADLVEESSDFAVLIEAVDSLLDRLTAGLRERQSQIQSLRLVFEHLHREPTVEDFELLEPSHERDRLRNLIRDRLERVVLPVPAVAVGLSTGPLEPMSSRAAGLFERATVETSAKVLLERLRGRFGRTGAYGIGTIAEHRPECAWAKLTDSTSGAGSASVPPALAAESRPLWMLSPPLRLASTAARRCYEGTVRLHSGPERIESGWWDGGDIGRDYYEARSSGGQRLWIYLDRRNRDWYLHGLFG